MELPAQTSPDQTRLLRKLRIALVLVAMLVGVAMNEVTGALLHLNSYLLASRGDGSSKRDGMSRMCGWKWSSCF